MSNVVSILNDLITIAKDGEQGFLKVAEEITNTELKNNFSDRAAGCAKAARELQQYVNEMGEEPTDSGSILGVMHRGWIDIKSVFSARDNQAILEECERGEDAAKTAYAKALEQDLPVNIRATIESQYEGVKKNLDLVRDLKNRYSN